MSPVLYIERCTSPCTVHGSGTLQKRSHQPLMSPVLYMSLEHFRSAPINHLMFCTVRESRTSENRTENKVKQKVNIRGYPGISLGRFVHCQYRNQSVSTPCTREKQSVSVTPSAVAAGPSAHFFTHTHMSSPPPLAYLPSSTLLEHTFLRLSATLLGCAFAPPFAASSRSSGERSIEAEILPHSLACFIPGLPRIFIPRAPSLDLSKKRSGIKLPKLFMF